MNAGFGNVPAMRILESTRLFALSVAVLLGLGVVVSLGCSGLALPGDLPVGIQTDYPPLAFALGGRVARVGADRALVVRAGDGNGAGESTGGRQHPATGANTNQLTRFLDHGASLPAIFD